eukprot:1012951_1
MPVLFWDFEAADAGTTVIPDSISGYANYAIELMDTAEITSEGLNCNGGYARTVGNIPSALFGGSGSQPHSLEAKFKLTTLSQAGTSPLALDSAYNTAGGYGHDQFDAIVYNELYNNGQYFAGSEYFSRTKPKLAMTGDGVVSETLIDESIHVVITYDPDQNLVTIYRNGEQYGDAYTPSGGFMTFDDYTRALICIRHYRTTSLTGVISGAAVYDYVLDSATVLEHYTESTDLCADVTCEDDGDACTIEYCDPDTGTCTSTDLECADSDACTVDTCDSTVGCVFTEMECSDGNICNGEEACMEGTCVSPNDFEC